MSIENKESRLQQNDKKNKCVPAWTLSLTSHQSSPHIWARKSHNHIYEIKKLSFIVPMHSWNNKLLKWNTWLKQNSKRKLTGYLALGNPLGQHGRRIQHWHWIGCTLVRGLQSLWSTTEKHAPKFEKIGWGVWRWQQGIYVDESKGKQKNKNREHEPTRLLACFFKGDCFPFEWIESNTFHCLYSKFAQTIIQCLSWTIVKKSWKAQKERQKGDSDTCNWCAKKLPTSIRVATCVSNRCCQHQ